MTLDLTAILLGLRRYWRSAAWLFILLCFLISEGGSGFGNWFAMLIGFPILGWILSHILLFSPIGRFAMFIAPWNDFLGDRGPDVIGGSRGHTQLLDAAGNELKGEYRKALKIRYVDTWNDAMDELNVVKRYDGSDDFFAPILDKIQWASSGDALEFSVSTMRGRIDPALLGADKTLRGLEARWGVKVSYTQNIDGCTYRLLLADPLEGTRAAEVPLEGSR